MITKEKGESSKLDIIINPLCPKCNSEMERKLGKYGYFWGCKNFKKTKCKGSVDIPKEQFIFKTIDYDGFVDNKPTKYLLDLIDSEPLPDYVKQLEDVLQGKDITKGTISRKDVEGKISGVFDYLSKNNRHFEMAKLAYWFYKLEGDLPGKIDFWLNRKPRNEYRNEKHITKAIMKYWNETPLGIYEFYDQEYSIGEWIGEFGGYFVDLVAKDNSTDELIFIEVKGFNQKANKAMGQLTNYVRYYNKFNPLQSVTRTYIIARGYPRNIFDDYLTFDMGALGYVVEDNEISFIPWKII